VGSSMSGKTSIVRALRWVYENRPLGSSFIRHGTKECSVGIEFLDVSGTVHTIEHAKSSKGSKYTINGNIYEAVGSDVPVDLQSAMDLQSENIQFQFDKIYLAMDSPGQIADAVNAVTNLQRADLISRELERLRRECGRKLSDVEERKSLLDKELQSPKYKNLDKLIALVEKWEKLDSTVQEDEQNLDVLTKALGDYQQAEQKLAGLEAVDRLALEFTNEIVPIIGLIDKSDKLDATLESIERTRAQIKSIDKIDVAQINATVAQAQEVSKSLAEGESQIELISRLLDITRDCTSTYAEIDSYLEDTEVESKELCEQLSVCPMCEEVLSESGKAKLLENWGK